MSSPISLSFFGSSENSLIVLKELLEAGYKIKFVITAPPRPSGRKQKLTKTPVHIYAEKNKMPVLVPNKLDSKFPPIRREGKILDSSNSADVAIVADYAKKLPINIINAPKHGALNLHPSLLPQYRGSTPVQTAILNGDKVTGLSIIKMDEQFDHGPILSWFKEEIRQPVYPEGIRGDTSKSLYKRLFEIGSEVLVTILPAWIEGRIEPREQDHSQATYAPKLTRSEGFIPWPLIQNALNGQSIQVSKLPPRLQQAIKENQKKGNILPTPYSLLLIDRAVRAFHPWPGIWTELEVRSEKSGVNKKRLKIISAHIENKKLILDTVQLEGQQPSPFNQIKNQILND
jgi:methionyl-tRNA formyltransferase